MGFRKNDIKFSGDIHLEFDCRDRERKSGEKKFVSYINQNLRQLLS